MKHSSENELNALSSGIIGVMGVTLLLIPSRLNMFIEGLSSGVIVTLGVLAFTFSISFQIVSILQTSQKRIAFIQSAVILFLFLFVGLFIRAGYFIEAFIFFHAAIMQMILATPLKKRFTQIDLLKVCLVLTGFSSGIYLAISN